MKRAQQTIVVDDGESGDGGEKRIKRLRTFSSDDVNSSNSTAEFIPLVVPSISVSPDVGDARGGVVAVAAVASSSTTLENSLPRERQEEGAEERTVPPPSTEETSTTDFSNAFLSAQQPSVSGQGEEDKEGEEEQEEEEEEKEVEKTRKNKQLSPASRLAARIDAVRKATTAVKRGLLPPPVLLSNVEHFAVFVIERNDAAVWRRFLAQSAEMQHEDESLCRRFFADARTRRRVEQRHRAQFKDIDWSKIIEATSLIRVPIPFTRQQEVREEEQQQHPALETPGRFIYIILVVASLLRNQNVPSLESTNRAFVLRRCAFLHAALEQKSTFLYVGDQRSLLKGVETLSDETSSTNRIVRAFCSARNSNAQHFVDRWHSLPAMLLAERLRMRVSNRNASNLRCWLSASLNAQEVRERNAAAAVLEDGEPRTTSLDMIEKHLGCIARNIMPRDFVVIFNDILVQFQQIERCECSMLVETTTPGLMVDACRLSFILFTCHRICTRNIDATVLAMADEAMPPPPPQLPPQAQRLTSVTTSSSRGGVVSGNFVRPLPLHHLATAIRQMQHIVNSDGGDNDDNDDNDNVVVAVEDDDNDVPSPPPPLPAQRTYSVLANNNNSPMRHVRPSMMANHQRRSIVLTATGAAARHAMRPHSGGGGSGNSSSNGRGSGSSGETLKKRVPDEPAGPNDAQCVICLTNRARYASVPCGHLCMCGECKRDLKHQPGGLVRCPLCKARTKSTVCIYIPMKTEPSACASTSSSSLSNLPAIISTGAAEAFDSEAADAEEASAKVL